jgi:hypothetical protein
MYRGMLALVGVSVLVGGCSGGITRTVDSPPIDVRAALASNESTLGFTDQLVGATHSSEATETGIVWHFAVNGQDYARYIITIADKPGGSRVSSSFEAVDGGPANPAIPFLRDSDKAASDEALLAALEHRPVNIANFQKALVINTVRDPSKITGMQQAIVGELDNAMKAMDAPSSGYQHHGYDHTPAYDRTPSYDRERVTQYEAERRRADAYGHR